MACTDLNASAGSFRLSRLEQDSFVDPKWSISFDQPVPEDATRFEIKVKGHKYVVKINCPLEREVIAEDFDVDTIEWQSGNVVRFTLNGSPDLSDLQVGDNIVVSGADSGVLNGSFPIVTIDEDYIEVTNDDVSDDSYDEATDSGATLDVTTNHLLKFYTLPVAMNLFSCGVDIEGTIEFFDCDTDPCFRVETPIQVDEDVLSDDFGISEMDNTLNPAPEVQLGDVSVTTATFEPVQTDDDDDPRYYAFQRNDGVYYIMRATVSGGGSIYEYSRGTETDWSTDWPNRASLTYGDYDAIF